MKKKVDIKWLSEPADKDYPAAESFLLLYFKAKAARALVKKLKRAEMAEFAAKDIFRASETPIAEVRAFDWAEQKREIQQGAPLSPLLLVRQDSGRHLIVADGFHRLCAAFSTDEDVTVPCKIV
jgi:hypothetical protein